MIKRLSHVGVYVKDQNEALRFYTEAVGFEVRTDVMGDGDFRWLTVGPKDQPDFEIALMPLKPFGFVDADAVQMLTALQDKGVLSGGVCETDDIHKTYEEMKAKGVQFISPPTQQPYGIEAIWKDNSGNWFSLAQR